MSINRDCFFGVNIILYGTEYKLNSKLHDVISSFSPTEKEKQMKFLEDYTIN